MRLGIDASNISAGGGVTHLAEILRAFDPSKHGFSQVFVWSTRATLNMIEDHSWLIKSHDKELERGLPNRVFWQQVKLVPQLQKAGCDLLFVPGGSYVGTFHPTVTMSRNMLPFDWGELRRYGWGFASLRLVLLRWIQARTFRKADGVIFLTRHAQNMVTRTVRIDGRTAIIPHGVDGRFVHAPRDQLSINEYSEQKPYRILYVSSIDVYKHQWRAAEAIAQLRGMGVPVVLDLVGPAHAIPFRWLTETLDRVDPGRAFVRYLGKVSYAELHEHYLRADLFMFASSCETMPNILLEGMASGLPIACSDRGPMPEVLGDAGVYFDPEDAKSIQEALNRLIRSPELRTEKAHAAFEKVGAYSWRRCADEAFRFLADVARNA